MPEERKCGSGSCDKSSCENCKKNSESFIEKVNAYSTVKKVIGVVSGKGGVGKSLVTGMLAVLTRQKGYNVAVLDADITGPSVPKMFGITKNAEGNELGLLPARTETGISVMSINLLLPKQDIPVIWRVPIIANTVKQFWTDVLWGDVDYMFIDMPPGTGDVPLTVFQSIPLDGIVIVTSPQELVSMIVKKAYNMAEQMHIPVLGIVENMSYVKCPDCGKEIKIFGESHIEDTAKSLNTKVLGKLPIDPAIASLCDRGLIEKLDSDKLPDAVNAVEALIKN
ncbi:MAG: Mrp/NBP35 family ATP-binding protein [Bacillota bacterium]|nr:Mrp/NBP35 family ATP-binding protein [Bacillota bacterium]